MTYPNQHFERDSKPFQGLKLVSIFGVVGIILMMSIFGISETTYQPPPDPDGWERELCQMMSKAETVANFTFASHTNESGELVKFFVFKKGIDGNIANAEFILDDVVLEIRSQAAREGIQIPKAAWAARVFNQSGKSRVATDLWIAGESHIKRNSTNTWRQVSNVSDRSWSRCRNNLNIKMNVINPNTEFPTFWIGTIK